jgi:hypothetical protein
MKFSFRYLVLTMAFLLAATAAFAQTTGTITGTVIHEGSPLPGVTVSISSPAMQGTRVAVTNEAGGYNFGAVPPGNYNVLFEMSGMQPVSRTTRVGVAQTARVDAALRLTAVAEAITVTAAAPAVLETQDVQTNIQADLVDNLPMGRTLAATTLLAPGTTSTGPNNAITISGGYSYDNLFLVNGAVTNENVRGQSHNLFIEDAIQETTIMSGGVSAEFGFFTGGVVSAITRSGGNVFSGSLRNSLTNEKWTAMSPWPAQGERLDDLQQVWEGTFGGRIIRDRLWFFGAGRFFDTESTGRIFGTDTTYISGDSETRLEGKLTGAITPRHNLVASYLDISREQDNNCFIRCLELSNLDVHRELPNSFSAFQYNGVLTNNWLLEANYSEKQFAFVGSGGDSRDRVFGTVGYEWDTGGFFGAPYFCGVCDDETRDNEFLTLKSTYYLSTGAFGTHNIVVGAERLREMRFANNFQSGSNFVISVYSADPRDPVSGQIRPVIMAGDVLEWWPVLQGSQGSNLATNSLFINDRIDWRNFSFNLGARYDQNDAVDSAGNQVADDSNISPRLGVNWDIFGNGRVRGTASYSRYVSRVTETIGGSASAAGSPAYISWWYDGPTINANRQLDSFGAFAQLFAWFDSIGGLNSDPDVTFIPGLTTQIPGTLRTPNVDEFTIGAGFQLTPNAYVRLDWINREWGNFYTSITDLTTGQVPTPLGPADLQIVTNSDFFERSYDALQVQAQWRLGQRFNLGGNYTWSELTGNSVGEGAGTGPVTDTRLRPEYTGFVQNAPVGYLPADQRHKARAWVSFDQPTPIGTFNFSVLQRFDSGTSYSASGLIDPRFSPNFYGAGQPGGITNPGYASPPQTVTYFFSERGAFRWDDVHSTDLAVNYYLPIRNVNLFLQGELINALNNDAQIGGNTTVLTHRNVGSLQRFNPFTDTPVENVHFRYGAQFGQPTGVGSFQLPRTYRVSAGLRF